MLEILPVVAVFISIDDLDIASYALRSVVTRPTYPQTGEPDEDHPVISGWPNSNFVAAVKRSSTVQLCDRRT